jgi:UDP-perosamine 4-acetyltransferase
MRVAIFGAGGHAKVVFEILEALGHLVVGFVDVAGGAATLLGAPVVRDPAALSFEGAIVAIGDNRIRKRVFEEVRAAGYALVNAVHPSAILSPRSTLGAGVVVVAGAIVNVDAVVGDNVILNTGCTVDHDGRIESHSHIAPGTHLGGDVQVGEGAFVGLGGRVLPGVRIGAWATCGAGAVVLRDVPARVTVVGVPARVLGDR